MTDYNMTITIDNIAVCKVGKNLFRCILATATPPCYFSAPP